MQHTATRYNTKQHLVTLGLCKGHVLRVPALTATHTATHNNSTHLCLVKGISCSGVHCNTHCNTLHHTAPYLFLQKGISWQFWHTLQHAATQCNPLQDAATRCKTLLQHTTWPLYRVSLESSDTATRRNALQPAATRWNTLQHAATHHLVLIKDFFWEFWHTH